jgi:hypothetical protein
VPFAAHKVGIAGGRNHGSVVGCVPGVWNANPDTHALRQFGQRLPQG